MLNSVVKILMMSAK